MKNKSEIKNIAIKTFEMEANALLQVSRQLDDDFNSVVNDILTLKGRVVITGIGKSAIIAQKIVATLNSTGTPSLFMHAADAIHGDLGMIQQNDLIIVISKSGNTPEIKVLVPLLKQTNSKIVALVGNRDSFLAINANYILDVTVDREACPFDLAPTTSTTAQLAMGDALAVCLIEARQFTDKDFARYHPGGALGKRLYMTVNDLIEKNSCPQVGENATIKEIIMEITKNRLGAVGVIKNDILTGIITDGDIRRMLEAHDSTDHLRAKDIMGSNPKTIESSDLAINALTIMRAGNISQLLVTRDGVYDSIIHIQDLLREGII